MQRSTSPGLLIALLIIGLGFPLYSQSPDYRIFFGNDWTRAEAWEKENREWMKDTLESSGISYPLAVAVVFPEIVRYSALRDVMETSMLRILYVNLGEEYANFSIGQFQMKPAFAEWIRNTACDSTASFPNFYSRCREEYDDAKEYRKSIVSDLEEPGIQLLYLSAFIRICDSIYNTEKMYEKDRVKFISTVYNAGPGKSMEEILHLSTRKYYSTKLIGSEKYPYSDISVFWYEKVYLNDVGGFQHFK